MPTRSPRQGGFSAQIACVRFGFGFAVPAHRSFSTAAMPFMKAASRSLIDALHACTSTDRRPRSVSLTTHLRW